MRMVSVGFTLLYALGAMSFASGCGYKPTCYSPQADKDTTSIAVSIFENSTLWRGCEFDLTNRVRGEILARTPLRLAKKSEEADLVLTGEIVDYVRPVLVEDSEDRVFQSQVSLTLKVLLKDRPTDKIIYEGFHTEAAEFIGARDETEAQARYEIYEKLARWVVALLEEPSD